MAKIVMKFGGAALGSTEQIQEAARKAIAEKDKGFDVVVVVAAMGHTVKEMKMMVHQLTDDVSKRELDAVLSTGSQLSSALFAIALQEAGYTAVSLTGWQAGIHTDGMYRHARIDYIDVSRMEEHFTQGQIVVIAGEQGLTKSTILPCLGRWS